MAKNTDNKSDKKSTKKIDKKENKEPKKLEIQDPIGRSRPLLGAVLLFLSIIFSLAAYDYRVGQDIFFADSMFSFLSSTTELQARNICGKLGATITSLGLWTFGAAYYMILLLLLYVSLFCFKRRPRLLPLGLKITMPVAIIFMSLSAAALQRAFSIDASVGEFTTAYFRNGWGGVIAIHLFEKVFMPLINVTGSLILFLGIYFASIIIIFVENPSSLGQDLGAYAKSFGGFLKRMTKGFLGIFKFKRKERADVVELQSEDILLSPSGKEEIKIGKTRKKKIKDEDILSAPSEEEMQAPIKPKAVEPEIAEPEPEIEVEPEVEPDPVVKAKKIERIDFSDLDELEPIKPISKEVAKSLSNELKIERYEAEKAKDIETASVIKGDYIFPPLDLLTSPPVGSDVSTDDYQSMMDDIIAAFATFKIKVEQAGVFAGPVITRYEVRPAAGVRVSKIAALEKDLAMALQAYRVRIIAPVPGKGTVGIEVPNQKRQAVYMRDILESPQWIKSKAEIPVVLGKDVAGVPIVEDLAKMPHALVAGSTGSGKSVCVNAIIASLCYKYTPDDLRFIMIDPKVVEFQAYNSLPHMLVPVVTDAQKAPSALKWLLTEMGERYRVLSACNVKNIASFNAKIAKDEAEAEKARASEATMTIEERLALEESRSQIEEDGADIKIPKKKYPFIVCIIDELAALMAIAKKDVELTIVRLTQEARAAGIHLILATQRPSTDIITGVIKANLPVRIAFKVTSLVDSRTILDSKGAETLIGKGDMLFVPPGSSDLIRAQGAFMTEEETFSIVEFLKQNGEPEYVEEVQSQIDAGVEGEDEDTEDYGDPMVGRAIDVIRSNQKASISFLQRKLSIGYGRASRIMDILEEKGFVGEDQGPNKQRDIFL